MIICLTSFSPCKARFAFSRGDVVKEVPYDPHLEYVLHSRISHVAMQHTRVVKGKLPFGRADEVLRGGNWHVCKTMDSWLGFLPPNTRETRLNVCANQMKSLSQLGPCLAQLQACVPPGQPGAPLLVPRSPNHAGADCKGNSREAPCPVPMFGCLGLTHSGKTLLSATEPKT